MYLATTDTATAKASPGVFAARREKGRKRENAHVAFVSQTRAPGDGHHYDPAGILAKSLTLSLGG